jgi:paired amphipathic helix protein Sin3a
MYNHHPHLNPYPPGYPVPSFPSHQSPHPLYAYDPPAHPPAAQPILPLLPQASMQDVNFFNRVKVYSTDIATYHEFLKLLNLYTQDILDLTALVSRAYLFIGQEASLWKDFREIVGWTDGVALGETGGRIEIVDGVRVIENVPSLDGPRRGKGDSGKGWKTHGPSYRQLPQSEISLNCSGRDALCWDVLNDEWGESDRPFSFLSSLVLTRYVAVSQPSWASDEGFVAHRKNPYEEALHRSEEERHEYDYHIEANLRTIALLEPIATRIAIMEADERATFRLKPGLGNQSKSIYQRVIKKVYGSEQGGEVIQALHENPCVAVPIVLARLKQKDDEWKRALREWNRVWRDVVSPISLSRAA